MGSKTRTFLCAAAMVLAVASPDRAVAQSGGIDVQNEPNFVMGAIAIIPDYVGSDDYTFAVGPSGRYSFKDNRYVKLVATTLTTNLLNDEILRLGPVLNYRFGRDDVDDEFVDRMSDVDDSFEIGLNFGAEWINKTNQRYRFGASLEWLQDVSGGHEGFLITPSMYYWRPLSKAWDLGLVTSATYGSGDYMSAFFSVDAADSASSGLPQYNANDGLRDISFTPVIMLHLSRTWHVGGFLKYQRLLSDAGDSPVVDPRGTKNQLLFGIGVAYSW